MMRQLLLSTGSACALGLFAICGTANAGAPDGLSGTAYVVPVEQTDDSSKPDSGNIDFWSSDDVNDEVGAGNRPGMEPLPYSEGGGNVEEQELQRMFPERDWPKK